MTTYKDNDPKGWHGNMKYGAALGRNDIVGDFEYSGKMKLCRVYLDNGGYDCNSTYFGHGAPLYWYASVDGTIDRMIRAGSREKAKELVLEQYPNARFYR